MAETLAMFDQRVLDGTVETCYTVPSNHTFVVKTIAVTNYSTSTANISIWFVAGADNNGNKNIIVKAKSIIPGETIFINSDMYLQAGYKIMAQASVASSINFQLSGVDMS